VQAVYAHVHFAREGMVLNLPCTGDRLPD